MNRYSIKNLYDYVWYNEWKPEDKDEFDTYEGGFSMRYVIEENENDKLFDMLMKEIKGSMGDKKKSLMWVERVKKMANWKKGDTIYGNMREKHTEFNVWFSRNKEDIGLPFFIIEPSGFVALYYHNQYSLDETEEIKRGFYVRPDSIYNDKIAKQNSKK